jgi:hypothetical protein
VANTVRSSFQLKGTKEVIQRLKDNSEEIIEVGIDAVSEALDILLQSTIDDCPVGEDVDDEEGHLKDSIEKEEPKKYKRKIKGYVKVTKPTAIHHCFALHHHPLQICYKICHIVNLPKRF